MDNEVFIYALCTPIISDVRYVGKSIHPDQRLQEHLKEKGNTRKCRWVHSLDRAPILKILEAVAEGNWEEAERRQIRLHREAGCDLTNHTDGGDGRTAFLPEERIAQGIIQRERLKDPEYRKKVFTPERAANISKSLAGKPKSSEHVAHLPQNNKGFKQSAESCARKSIASTGRKQTEKWKSLMVEIRKGNKFGIGNKSRSGQNNSSEMNDKISASQKGRSKSEEQRRKMSLARAEWWRRKEAANVTQLSSKRVDPGSNSSEPASAG